MESRDEHVASAGTGAAVSGAPMSERIREIVDVPVSFVQEGVHFLNRCTKPDRKGMRARLAADHRVYPDLPRGRYGFRRDGFHRLPREAGAHPDQQHCTYCDA